MNAFTWQVWANGYKWEGDFLDMKRVPGSAGGWRRYRPGTALFREFADTEVTPEGVLLFANRYGDPGEAESRFIDWWRKEITAMREAIRLWDQGEGDGLPELIDNALLGRIIPRFAPDPHTCKLAMQIVPQSLIGALWLQLAGAIGTGTQFRRCDRCGAWFEVSGRVDRKLCSGACRSASYRGRQEQARQLAAEGKGFREIARELGSNAATVRKWVRGR
jgi:hypothetical protein